MDNSKRFEALVNAFSADLYRYAFWLCRDPTLADDLVQETFLRAWRFLDTLRDEKKAKSWLITTLRREHARQFERVRPELVDMDLDRIAADSGSVHAGVDSWMLHRALLALPEKYREPLVLQVVGGYSGAEISQMLGLPEATINTRVFRARQRLRKIVASGVRAARDSG